jgi:hypothetical protein
MNSGVSLQEKQLSQEILRVLSSEHLLCRYLQVCRDAALSFSEMLSQVEQSYFPSHVTKIFVADVLTAKTLKDPLSVC